MYSFEFADRVFQELYDTYGRVLTYALRIVGLDRRKATRLLQEGSPGWEELKRLTKQVAYVSNSVGWAAMVGPNYHTHVQQAWHRSGPHEVNTLFGDLDPRMSVLYARRAQNNPGTSAARSIFPV